MNQFVTFRKRVYMGPVLKICYHFSSVGSTNIIIHGQFEKDFSNLIFLQLSFEIDITW